MTNMSLLNTLPARFWGAEKPSFPNPHIEEKLQRSYTSTPKYSFKVVTIIRFTRLTYFVLHVVESFVHIHFVGIFHGTCTGLMYPRALLNRWFRTAKLLPFGKGQKNTHTC